MRQWVTGRRGLALLLLVALPAAATGRLALDAAWNMGTTTDIETQHASCDAPAHDHRVCGLILNSPWTLPPVPPVLPLALPESHAGDHPVIASIGFDPGLLRLPRSPPLS